MTTCTHCRQQNRPGAFYCKNCGRALACPRCRIILSEPGNFCDNCGQVLGTIGTVESSTPISNQEQYLQPAQEEAPHADISGESAISEPNLGRFVPDEFMTKLEAARTNREMVGERRVVTMLFCDVKGSTAAAEQLDPEDWTEVINGAFEHMIRPVYKYEGTVARLMGDGILAFFGAPIAHEDDAQRAVLAALDIAESIKPYQAIVQDRFGVDIAVRVGINTGRVVVGAVGSDLRMEYTAMGDAINLASRMEQLAKPGTVQIAGNTHKLVMSLFEFEALGAIPVKGKEKPVQAYRVLGKKATSRRSRGLNGQSVPLVGRELARSKLTAVLDKLVQGSGQIVCIIGEVGLGKSRLIEELHQEWSKVVPEANKQEADSEPSLSRWFETFSVSYETTRPYSLFRHLIRQVLGATQSDPPAILSQKIDTFVTDFVPNERQDQFKRVLKSFYGLGENGATTLEGETFRNQLFETITYLVERWASDAPGVIVCDDIHWSDPASVELLLNLFSIADRQPILFLCATRPDRHAPAWQITTTADHEYPHRYTELQLDPLTREDSHTLVNRLLNNEQLPDSLRETILVKAAGNPFFIEEVIRTLIENESIEPTQNGEGWNLTADFEAKQITIPDSLQSLLMARIDRLDESPRRTLQMAALIGRSFYYRVLELILEQSTEGEESVALHLDEHLGNLQRLELISQVARLPELEFIFQQALVQESAYKTILLKQRRKYHRMVGEAMEILFPEQLDEHAIVLAGHFMEAGDYDRALKYHTIAADAAYRFYANAEAVEHYSRALEAAQHAPVDSEQLIHLYTRRGRAFELSARTNEAVDNYEAMRQQAHDADDQEMELAALMNMATLYSTPTKLYDLEKGESLLQQALQLVQELDDRAAEAKILWNMLNLNRFSGRNEQALDYGERSLTIARELNITEQIAYTLNDLCHLYNRTGQYDKSKEALKEAILLWRELNNLPMLTDSLSTASYVYTFTSDFDQAISFSEEALQISQSIQNIWGISYSQWVIGWVYWECGLADQAFRVMKDSISHADKAGFMVAQVYTRCDLAIAYASLGDINKAMAVVEEADKIAEASHLQLRPYALAHKGRIHIISGDLQKAEEYLKSMRTYDLPVHLNYPDMPTVGECQLLLLQGKMEESILQSSLRLELLQANGLTLFVPETYHLLGEAYRQAGRNDEAISALEDGLSIARATGSIWREWQLLATKASLMPRIQASMLRAEAAKHLDLILENLTDPVLQNSFLNLATVKTVRGEVKELHGPET